MNNVFLREDAVQAILVNTPVRCFHCGIPYKKDDKYCDQLHSTWMPACDCLNKPTIRIVTGGQLEIEEDPKEYPEYKVDKHEHTTRRDKDNSRAKANSK